MIFLLTRWELWVAACVIAALMLLLFHLIGLNVWHPAAFFGAVGVSFAIIVILILLCWKP